MPTLKAHIKHQIGRLPLKRFARNFRLLIRGGARSTGYKEATTMVLDGGFEIAGLPTFLHRAFTVANRRFYNLPNGFCGYTACLGGGIAFLSMP
jgi:hypothetical protein